MPSDDSSSERPELDPLEAAQTLSDSDQTSSDADQTGVDLDQTSSEADQGASERDQWASDRDQHAADLDQAAGDRAHGAGHESASYAESRRTRSETTSERDLDTQTRMKVAQIREATAERRDRDAEARDAAAAARDELAAALDADVDRLERAGTEGGNGAVHGLELLLQASRTRKRAGANRVRAAAQREEAARDRAAARADREQATADRAAAAAELAAEGIDSLTGTLRRRVGRVAIQREIDRTARTNAPIVVGFVDVDGLKTVNDTHGHDVGDDLLFGVASCIKLCLRPYDVIARFGGDEFVCSLSGQDLAGVRLRFEEISAHIAETQNGASITVGLAERRPEESLDELISRADREMITARRARG